MKKLSFIFDKAAKSIENPILVPNHAVAVRQFVAVCSDDKNKDLLFVKFPSDFDLVTVELSFKDGVVEVGKPEISPFIHLVETGDSNGE